MTIDPRYFNAYAKNPLPKGARKPASPRNQNERHLQSAVVQAIEFSLPDVFVTSIPGGSARLSMGQRVKLKAAGTKSGMPDLLMILPCGTHGWMELKNPTKNVTASSLSPTQKAFAELCAARGVRHAVCNSVEGALDTVRGWM